MFKELKVPRGTARKNRRAKCKFWEISPDGKDAHIVSYHTIPSEYSHKVFAPNIKEAYWKIGKELAE